MSHTTDPIYSSSSNRPDKVVEDYLIVPQDSQDRPTWYASNDLYTGLATTLETDAAFNAFDFFLPVGGGPPLHYHVYENEAWYGIEGDLLFSFGNQAGEQGTEPKYTLTVPPETLVFGPRLRPHTYNNIDSTDSTVGENAGARTLSFTTPGGLDLFFDYVGIPVEDRNNSIPLPGPPTPEILAQLVEIGGRISNAPYFILPEPDYVPSENASDYVVVLPENPAPELVEAVLPLSNVDGFKIWQIGKDPDISLPSRPTFTGPFDIEYTSLLTLEETDNELSYNQFSLAPQATDTFVAAKLTDSQVVEPTDSSATGVANLELDEAGEIEYNLTVTGLDFGELVNCGIPQTSDNELDDVTGLHIHTGKRGSNGEHAFSILDPNHQDETEPSITINKDGSATISGTWNQTEQEIPTNLKDFFSNGGLPGQETDFYFQVHTEGNPEGEIRGQIAHTSDDFPELIESENYEALYVKEGQLSLQIGDEVRLVGADDFVYIPPGTEYSLANFGETEVESLAVSVIPPTEDGSIIPDDTTGYKAIKGTDGDDLLIAGSRNKLVGGEGDDLLKICSGGDNLLYGGLGADQFWIADGQLPDTVPETRQLTNPPPPFPPLPPLEDTQNTIADFELGVDKIYISGIEDISSFEDLKLLPAFGDIQSTSILATVDGIEGELSLANVADVQFNQLSEHDFVFA